MFEHIQDSLCYVVLICCFSMFFTIFYHTLVPFGSTWSFFGIWVRWFVFWRHFDRISRCCQGCCKSCPRWPSSCRLFCGALMGQNRVWNCWQCCQVILQVFFWCCGSRTLSKHISEFPAAFENRNNFEYMFSFFLYCLIFFIFFLLYFNIF